MANLERCEDCGKLSISGDTVTIPATQYELLVARASAADLGKIKNYRLVSRTRIARNPEYAEFILRCLPVMTVTETLRAFTQKFGDGNISRSQLYRFSQDLGFSRKQ